MVSTPNKINEHIEFQDSFHSLKQRYPHKKNHYKFEDFFQHNPQSGTITDWNGARNIIATEDFIVALIEGLEKEVGSASTVLLYNIGREWGYQDTELFKSWFETEYKVSIQETHPSFLFEAWWWPFTSQGWGNWEIDLSDQRNGFMFVNIFDSAVARTLGDVGKPVCHLYAGLFAGFFSKIVNKDLGCIEIQCYAMGETYCRFLLGRKEKIDAATFWQNEGATARDIEKRLVSGEYLK
ncbi:4-vinyl reductase [Lyngbya confervoides BDU141951]|uniref:4-vinyl reductase n=1 Tax=Lyngbya confervoides BDU141951 TaxID=1574623 RepID=A0ABD4T5F3_9CYAN|nr:V4R domain-containing protein [Lyngbya confervoides]MCM1983819.1 4-vinyl reductase [Lyngbya confervoides BDU141951]